MYGVKSANRLLRSTLEVRYVVGVVGKSTEYIKSPGQR